MSVVLPTYVIAFVQLFKMYTHAIVRYLPRLVSLGSPARQARRGGPGNVAVE